MFRYIYFIIILLGFAKPVYVQPQPEGFNTFTLILIEDSVYAYKEPDMSYFERYTLLNKSFHNYVAKLANLKNEDSLFFRIKPSKKSTYKNIVDVLDEMTINKIYKFSVDKLTTLEERFFGLESRKTESDSSITTTTFLYTKPYLLFHLKASSEISYLYVDSTHTSKEVQIDHPSTKTIFEELNRIENHNSIDWHKIAILIKGDNSVKFKDFDALIEAFRQKAIYKYSLITN